MATPKCALRPNLSLVTTNSYNGGANSGARFDEDTLTRDGRVQLGQLWAKCQRRMAAKVAGRTKVSQRVTDLWGGGRGTKRNFGNKGGNRCC